MIAGRAGSVGSFKRDLQRVIDDQPVEAHPPSLRYQLSKFARQHFLFTVSCLAMTIAVCVGFVGMRRGQILARAAEQESRLALAAEKSANDRSRLAIAAFSDALSLASFSEADSEQALRMRFVQNEDCIDFISEVPVCSNSCRESDQELDELYLGSHRAGLTFARFIVTGGRRNQVVPYAVESTSQIILWNLLQGLSDARSVRNLHAESWSKSTFEQRTVNIWWAARDD